MGGGGGWRGTEGQNAKEPNDTLFIAKLRDESFILPGGAGTFRGSDFFCDLQANGVGNK